MKKSDLLFIVIIVAIFIPFVVFEPLYEGYKAFNASHGMVMSFLKFAVLSTLGELLGLRLSSGKYLKAGFGIVPRAVVWGILGMGINLAMIVFANGVPVALEYIGLNGASSFMAGPFCAAKVLVAFCISVAMNSIFAPVFMTFHKITDTHILDCGGSVRALVYHYFPVAERSACLVRRSAGCGFGSLIGGSSPKEVFVIVLIFFDDFVWRGINQCVIKWVRICFR